MTIKFGWGWKIALLYSSFVVMMLVLVFASTRQKFDLVSKDYYKEEIEYQKVIDAGRNQAGLSGIMTIKASDLSVEIGFPSDLAGKPVAGTVVFYSAVSKDMDRKYPIETQENKMTIDRSALQHTIYKVKVSYTVDGTNYYNEHDLDLSK
ncbi:hypothetical protein GCM10023093_20570 [Nemorincola caseinilytica]|uniref:FixH protein n=1 Tax=Nemorincola caseinilytica TaxID=2054315 RepID=A0ABP8NJ76_9BACT